MNRSSAVVLALVALLAGTRPSASAAASPPSPSEPNPASLASKQAPGAISGRVLDASGAVLHGADVTVRQNQGQVERTGATDEEGRFEFRDLPPGDYALTAVARGLSTASRRIALGDGERAIIRLRLEPSRFAEEVTVTATHIAGRAESLQRIPGSVDIIGRDVLDSSRVFTTSEALRKAAGVTVREEEGFGLRPNIGIRGVNPTRSTKVLFLEDGIPLAYAPYGDNASYYHPPIERFQSIEVLKGSGQIAYGPVTVAGVVNYITPAPPLEPTGAVTLIGGNRSYLNGHLNYGGTWRQLGVLVDYLRKEGDGARENTHSDLNDLNLKVVTPLAQDQTLTLKGSYYGERSNVTYSGLREDEYRANPRQNPFRNDDFEGNRYGASATHTYALTPDKLLVTQIYGSYFSRDWWRQSSNSGQRPNDSDDPDCGGMANLNTTCGNQGRLRDYKLWGVEPRLRFGHRLFGPGSEAEIGARLHVETQDRQQQNGATPTARAGTVVEDNERTNRAYSFFLQDRVLLGKWTLTPGLRAERIRFERTNRLANEGRGASGSTSVTQLVPGLGVTYVPSNQATVFAGVHRGFAPPRTEDIVSNSGGTVDLDPELSWNYEVGLRSTVRPGVRLDATLFRIDYENQVVPASLAGGVGATLTNGGETLHQGIEVGGRLDTGELLDSRHNLYFRAAFTYLPTASFRGVRFSNVSGFGDVRVDRNRLPYAPRRILNASLGYAHPSGLDVMLEASYLSDQFADDLNSIDPSPDGQRGLISSSTIWNATVNCPVRPLRTILFVTVKNLLDDTFIVDRSRGILPGSPRLVQGGFRFRL